MTSLSLERFSPSSRTGNATAAAAMRLGQFVSAQMTLLRTSRDVAAAYDRARSSASRRVVLDRFSAQIGH